MRYTALILTVSAAASAQPVAWTNATQNNQWTNPNNWNPAGVPGPTNAVAIAANFPQIVMPGADIQSLAALSPIRMTSGTLRVAQESVVKDFEQLAGNISTGALFTLQGTTTLSDGPSWFGAGSFRNQGSLTMQSLNLASPLFNSGSVTVNGALGIGGTNTFGNTGTLELRGAASVLSSGLIQSTGTIRKTQGGTSSTQGPVELNGGSLTVDSGALRMSGAVKFAGAPVVIQGSSELRLLTPSPTAHTFTAPTSVTGAGNFVIESQSSGANPPVQFLSDTTFNLTSGAGLHLMLGNALLDGLVSSNGHCTWGNFGIQGQGELHNGPAGLMNLPSTGGMTISSGAILSNEGTLTIAGPVSVNGGSIFNQAKSTLGWSNGTIGGSFQSGFLDNRGTIVASGPSSELHIRFDQQDSGRLLVSGGHLSMTAGMRLDAGASKFDFAGTNAYLGLFGGAAFEVRAGNHTASGAGKLEQGSNTVLSVASGASLTLNLLSDPPSPAAEYLLRGALGGPGTITNEGTFEVQGTIGSGDTANFFNKGGVLITGGTLRGIFINELGAEVANRGNFFLAAGAQATNKGLWVSLPPSSLGVLMGTGSFSNEGVFIHAPATPQSGSVSCSFSNTGSVSVERGTLSFSGPIAQLQNGELTGGTWIVAPGANLIFPPPLTKIKNSAHVVGNRVGQGGFTPLQTLTEISSGGRLEANGDITVNGPLDIRNGGRLDIKAPADVRTTFTYSGWGKPLSRINMYKEDHDGPDPAKLITPNFENAGIAAPGGPGEAGPFLLVGNYEQTTPGELELEIGGLAPINEHDQMTVEGDASLAGRLRILLFGNFQPAVGQSYLILTATGVRAGQFETVLQPPDMPAGLRFVPVYDAHTVRLAVQPVCYPDCNTDGALNLSDFGCFQTRFALGDPYADCNGDGVRNLSDFGCFQTRFALGCP